MALASVACAGAGLVLFGAGARWAVLLGMIGPLAVAAGSWTLVQRTQVRAPARVPGLMIKLFAGKMVVVGGYVAAVVLFLPVRPVPFVASFTAQYALLHMMEAWYLRRLFLGNAGALER
jgi:hypothetical protein